MYTPVAGAGAARQGKWIEGREEGDERLETPVMPVRMPERPGTPETDHGPVDENGQTVTERKPNDWVDQKEKNQK